MRKTQEKGERKDDVDGGGGDVEKGFCFGLEEKLFYKFIIIYLYNARAITTKTCFRGYCWVNISLLY